MNSYSPSFKKRIRLLIPIFFLIIGMGMGTRLNGQTTLTIYHDPSGGDMLVNTAKDVKKLLLGIKPSWSIQTTNSFPSTGLRILLVIDTTTLSTTSNCSGTEEAMNSACAVSYTSSMPNRNIRFSAPYTRGIRFGIYEYLEKILGFRFYLPEASDSSFRAGVSSSSISYPDFLWTRLPDSTDFSSIEDVLINPNRTMFAPTFKYHGFSGFGLLDDNVPCLTPENNAYKDWDLWKDRNGFWSDVKDITQKIGYYYGNTSTCSNANIDTCEIALHQDEQGNAVRYRPDAKPNINYSSAMDKFANICHHWYATDMAEDACPNPHYDDPYYFEAVSAAVEDGGDWGNAPEPSTSACTPGQYPNSNADNYPSPSDQNFILANYVVQKLFDQSNSSLNTLGRLRKVQTDAYSAHCDIPSPGITISDKLDIMMTPDLYSEAFNTTGVALRARWENRMANQNGGRRQLGEYYYYNHFYSTLGTPFNLQRKELTGILNWHKGSSSCHSLGMYFETNFSKFSPGFLLQMYNRFLKDPSNDIETSYSEFLNDMFGSAASGIDNLTEFWDKDFALGERDTKYYLLYESFRLLNDACSLTSDSKVQVRLTELKVYHLFLKKMFKFYDEILLDPSPCSNPNLETAFDEFATFLFSILPYKVVNSSGIIDHFRNKFISACGYSSNNIFNVKWYFFNQSAACSLVTNISPYALSQINTDFANELNPSISGSVADRFQDLQMDFVSKTSAQLYNEMVAAGYHGRNEIIANVSSGESISNNASLMIYNNISSNGKVILKNYEVLWRQNYINTMPDEHYALVVLEKMDKSYSTEVFLSVGTGAPVELPFAPTNPVGDYKLTFFTTIHGTTIKKMTIVPGQGNMPFQTYYQLAPKLILGNTQESSADPDIFYIPNVDRVYMYNPIGASWQSHRRPVFTSNNGCNITPVYMSNQSQFQYNEQEHVAYLDIPSNSREKFWGVETLDPFAFLNISNKFFFFEESAHHPLLPAPTVTANPGDLCASSNLSLTGSSSQQNISYVWYKPDATYAYSQSISSLTTPGNYYCRIQDQNNCISSWTLKTVKPVPELTTSTNSPVLCEEQLQLTASATVTGIQNPSLSFQWSHPGGYTSSSAVPSPISNPASGTYTCTVTYDGCSDTNQEIVEVESCEPVCPENLTITTAITAAEIKQASNFISASSTVTVASGEVRYRAGSYVLLDVGFETSVTSSGNFLAIIEECDEELLRQEFVIEQEILPGIKVYPNPFSDVINYSVELPGPEKNMLIEVVNSIGTVVYRKNVNVTQKGVFSSSIKPGSLTPGMYFLTIRTSRKKYDFKILKL